MMTTGAGNEIEGAVGALALSKSHGEFNYYIQVLNKLCVNSVDWARVQTEEFHRVIKK